MYCIYQHFKISKWGNKKKIKLLVNGSIPNPNKGDFGIDIITNQTGQLKIAVIDVLGRTIYTENQTLNGPVFVPISLPNAANGQYVVRAEINGHFFTRYVLINK